jgi:hypothetical protein
VLETIDRLDSALPITDSGVVNDRVERSQAVGLIGESPSLGDALETATTTPWAFGAAVCASRARPSLRAWRITS